jgi:acid stress-induced BolA-like protein IbaG/YrbA
LDILNVVTPQQIEGYLRDKLVCKHLEVEGDGAHFQAVIVCAAFEGKSRVARHQIVYGALGERMREEIHALSMKTLTPAEWSTQPQ